MTDSKQRQNCSRLGHTNVAALNIFMSAYIHLTWAEIH